ncbi:MAG: hypothetical protein IPL40_06780 [Proteobacteria bacterium]|nr:hypothetical protein [Pseudomonadota bacterium]
MVACLASLALGCSGDSAGPVGDEARARAHTFGLLTLRLAPRSASPQAAIGAATRLELSATAHLARFRGLSQVQVARLLALPLDPKRELPPLQECGWFDALRDGDEQDVAGADEGEIDLLEAGDIRVQTAGQSLALRPRSFAGLLPFVAGTVYEEAQGQIRGELQQAPVEIGAIGGTTVGAFALRVLPPALPAVVVTLPAVAVGDAAGAAGSDARPALELRWSVDRGPPGTMPDTMPDTMYLELQHAEEQGGPVLRCTVSDAGFFVLPGRLLEALDPLAKGDLLLETVRLRRTPFRARGLGEAEVRVLTSQRQRLIAP